MDWEAIKTSANKEHLFMLTRALCLFHRCETIPDDFIALRHSILSGTFSRFFTIYHGNAKNALEGMIDSHFNAFLVRLPDTLRQDSRFRALYDTLHDKPDIYIKKGINLKGIERLDPYSSDFQSTCEYLYFRLYATYYKRILGFLKEAMQSHVANLAKSKKMEREALILQKIQRQYKSKHALLRIQALDKF